MIAGLLIWYLTEGTKDPPAGGSIESVSLSDGNPCCTYNVKASIKGYDGEDCMTRAVIIDAITNEQGTQFDVARYRPDSDDDEGAIDSYIGINTPGSYIVRFILYAPNGTELDRQDSGPVTVSDNSGSVAPGADYSP
ncbi:hypothetical protein [Streptomyces virginiae]|uniref:hypothetical protein n=1 Tax=Streptomyces virginiae TaxID=1961 RepID=UPI0034177520